MADTKTQQAEKHLRKLLESWPGQEKLPTVKQLARAAKVSLMTMQKAVTLLTNEGRLRPVRGSGIYVVFSSERAGHPSGASPARGAGVQAARLILTTNEPIDWMRATWRQVVETFEARLPGVQVEVRETADPDADMPDADLFLCSQESLFEHMQRGGVLECSPYVDWTVMQEALVPNLKESFTFNGRQWAVPVFFNAAMCLFSVKGLRRLGMADLPDRITVEDWRRILQKAYRLLKGGPSEWTKPAATNFGYLAWLDKHGVRLTEAGQVDQTEANKIAWRRGLETIRSVREHVLPYAQVLASPLPPYEAVEKGQAACLMTTLPYRCHFDRHQLLPTSPPGLDTPLSVGFVAMNRQTAHPVLAGKLMSLLISRAGQEIMAATGRIALYPDVLHSRLWKLPGWLERERLLKLVDRSRLVCYRNPCDRVLMERIVNPLISHNLLEENEPVESVIGKILAMGQHYLASVASPA